MNRKHTTAPAHANRLIDETSPYLLQHARNPVDWRPWGTEAIETARREGKLIFLSVGYSTCYWCHVMERESFEDEATADVLNESFVSIKVDREERPDVDEIYMTVVQMLTGRGGWPMSVWLDPGTLKPVYAGIYFPKQPSHGLPSFTQVLEALAEAWKERPEELKRQAERVAQAVRDHVAGEAAPVEVGLEDVRRAIEILMGQFDATHGGFGRAPKFPQPAYLDLLLGARDALEETSRDAVDRAVRTTLDAMALGGMHDQVGGGFHRYSTDAKWLVPHFEKMLYDNAQLASTYARAARTYDDPFYEEVARRTLAYLEREMTSERGGLYSAQDAEVNAREGLNYLWTPAEVEAALARAGLEGETTLANEMYGLDEGPNFRDPHHPDDTPRHVLRLDARPEELATRFNLSAEAFKRRRQAIDEALLAARNEREQPGTDTKIIAGWNGLAIAALAEAAAIFGEPEYARRAARAAEFLLDVLRDEEGELHRSYRNGRGSAAALLEDYACLASGLLALHEATGNRTWLREARALVEEAEVRFRDEDRGAWFDTRPGRDDLFVRPRSTVDGAVPSGTSTMLLNLLDLFGTTDERAFLERAAEGVRGVSDRIEKAPLAMALSTLAVKRVAAVDPELLRVERSPRTPRSTDGSAPVASGERAVRAVLSEPELGVPRGGETRARVIFLIEDGWHLVAPSPEAARAGLRPASIAVNGGEGVEAAVDWPAGEPWRDGLRVYRSTVHVPVRIRGAADARGHATLTATWQPCREGACAATDAATFPIEIRDR